MDGAANSDSPIAPGWLSRGPGWLADIVNSTIEYAMRIRPIAGPGIAISQAPNGRMISCTVQPSPIDHLPFELEIVGVDGSSGQIRVYFGTVNGNEPDGMTPGDSEPYILDVSGIGYIYLEVTTDTDGTITDRSIGQASTMPGDSPGDYHQQIGSFSADDSGLAVAQAIGGSQWFELCGNVTPLWGLV